MSTKAITVHPPEEVAKQLGGISVPMLISLLKSGGYAYTSLRPGSKPWGRGRQIWGMTDDQIAAVIRGQARKHPMPEEPGTVTTPARQAPAEPGAFGWDGKSRLKRRRVRG